MKKRFFRIFHNSVDGILADAGFLLCSRPSCIKHFFFVSKKISNASECLCNALERKNENDLSQLLVGRERARGENKSAEKLAMHFVEQQIF